MNFIIGPSDNGKSSIIRAVNWCLFNRPLGTSFVANNVKNPKTISKIEIDDGTIIRRTRTKSENKQEITPPQELKKAFPVERWLNIQTQMDPLFLLSMSGGEAAKKLNEIVKLDIIDRTTKNISTREREYTGKVKQTESNLKDQEEQLSELNWINEAEEKVNESQLKVTTFQNMENELEFLQDKLDELEELEKTEIKTIPETVIEDIEIKLKVLLDEENEFDFLQDNLNQLKVTASDLEWIKKQNQKLEKEFQKIAPKTCPTCYQEVEQWQI